MGIESFLWCINTGVWYLNIETNFFRVAFGISKQNITCVVDTLDIPIGSRKG